MPTPLIIGHRGASAVAPENTMAAFSAAIRAGADGVEFDVHLSSDSVPVIIHDETLKRTGGSNKSVSELSAEELAKTDVGSWFSRARQLDPELFSSEGIPRLTDLFDLYKNTTGLLYLEMKCRPSQRIQCATVCCRVIQEYSMTHRVVMESFDHAAIAAVHEIDRSIRTAALFEPRLTSPRSLIPKRLVAQAIEAHANEIALHFRLVTNRLVENAKARGLKVAVWTVDQPAWITRCNDLGIEVLITNEPARMLRARDETKGIEAFDRIRVKSQR